MPAFHKFMQIKTIVAAILNKKQVLLLTSPYRILFGPLTLLLAFHPLCVLLFLGIIQDCHHMLPGAKRDTSRCKAVHLFILRRVGF